jgi:hypothetical protein
LQRDPIDLAFLAPLVERSRAALGGADFASAERDGGTLRYDEVIEEARSWLSARPPGKPISCASTDP